MDQSLGGDARIYLKLQILLASLTCLARAEARPARATCRSLRARLDRNFTSVNFLDNRGDMGTKGAAELLRRGFRVLNGVVQRRRGHDHRITNAAFVPPVCH